MSELDPFIKQYIYPDPTTVFGANIQSLTAVKNECLFVLDTNALLLPYYASSQNLEQIKSILVLLVKKGRLFIPGQVAREFATNRPERIKEIFQTLNQQLNTIKEFKQVQYPLLSDIPEYNELVAIEREFNATISGLRENYKKKLNAVLKRIKDWTWNDPISTIYKELFTKEVILDLAFDKEQIRRELQKRYLHKIPPGYKDQSKPDDGIGDLLIWYTILELGKTKNKHVVFVSGEEKSDWLYKSEGQTLYPRFELSNEFMAASAGCSFHLIRYSEFLELMVGADKLVKEIERIEHEMMELEMLREVDFFQTAYSREQGDSFNLTNIQLKIDKEMHLISSMVSLFIELNQSGEFQLQDRMIDNLTLIHRHSSFDYEIYKHLMHIFTIKDWELKGKDELYKYQIEIQELRRKVSLSLDMTRPDLIDQ